MTSVPPVVTPIGSSVLVTLLERCVDGDVRLIDGDNTLEGRVQMCFNGVFGFVCDTDGWMQEEADVVCTQLGSIAIPGKFLIPPPPPPPTEVRNIGSHLFESESGYSIYLQNILIEMPLAVIFLRTDREWIHF